MQHFPFHASRKKDIPQCPLTNKKRICAVRNSNKWIFIHFRAYSNIRIFEYSLSTLILTAKAPWNGSCHAAFLLLLTLGKKKFNRFTQLTMVELSCRNVLDLIYKKHFQTDPRVGAGIFYLDVVSTMERFLPCSWFVATNTVEENIQPHNTYDEG